VLVTRTGTAQAVSVHTRPRWPTCQRLMRVPGVASKGGRGAPVFPYSKSQISLIRGRSMWRHRNPSPLRCPDGVGVAASDRRFEPARECLGLNNVALGPDFDPC